MMLNLKYEEKSLQKLGEFVKDILYTQTHIGQIQPAFNFYKPPWKTCQFAGQIIANIRLGQPFHINNFSAKIVFT